MALRSLACLALAAHVPGVRTLRKSIPSRAAVDNATLLEEEASHQNARRPSPQEAISVGLAPEEVISVGLGQQEASPSRPNLIAGVPVLNYGGPHEAGMEQEWVVMVQQGTPEATLQRMCGESKNHCNLIGHADGGVPFIEMRATEEQLEAALRSEEGVAKYVEMDTEVHTIPDLDVVPGHDFDGTWGLARIGVAHTPRRRRKAGSGVTVYVFDTGVFLQHEEFDSRASGAVDLSRGHARICHEFEDDCAFDYNGHGTRVAGIVAGKNYGVAPAATVKSMKVMTDRGTGRNSWIYFGLDWVAVYGPRPAVASLALGAEGILSGFKDSIDDAVNAGVVVVVAAGNENRDACRISPAHVPRAITVASSDIVDSLSLFSNYGNCVKIAAPGTEIYSADASDSKSYTTKSGTSMACSFVAGAAALLLQADPDQTSLAVARDMVRRAEQGALKNVTEDTPNALLAVFSGARSAALDLFLAGVLALALRL